MFKTILAGLFLSVTTFTAQAQDENTKVKVGQSAPDISYPNLTGQTLKLSEINKGRVVLLDFWASWCRPCRAANPGLVRMYEKYKGKKFKNAKKGFTIVSVSLDKFKEAWEKAVTEDKLSWEFHMSDLGYWDSKPAAVYGVQYIPQAFLIGPDGKIVGKYNLAEEAAGDIEKLLAQ